ncbi:TPA: hypothetical protein N0F65_012777 [Lagenidium giganteum]|uniref:PH domain-containing protein n=1 Tax=Lagenidium giganteum TaxID=4803 RepID=A0AAV2YGJ6_9STRA|nr:TPA: hypothetical protein N0F65_012777 [Lagenidium giganteum]
MMDPSVLCKYKSGKCSNHRALKRNGQLHTLCNFHRVRQNEHQRKSDRKHRMENVARRAVKLGSAVALNAVGSSTVGRRTRRNSVGSISSELASSSESAPASPMDISYSQDDRIGQIFDRYKADDTPDEQQSAAAAIITIKSSASSAIPPISRAALSDGLPLEASHASPPPSASSTLSTPTGRLPPISFLTQQMPTPMGSKLDQYRPSSNAMLNLPPSAFLKNKNNPTLPERLDARMSAANAPSQLPPNDAPAPEDNIQVTSPTSLALRESVRRSSSASVIGIEGMRSTSGGERQPSRMNRNSFFSRAPPPPPPAHPPQLPVPAPLPVSTPTNASQASTMASTAPSSGSGLTRPSSNPSLSNLGYQHDPHGHSLGPTASTPMGASNNNSSFVGRKTSARRSILRETFSALTRDKDNTPATIPEGASMDVRCEGYLTKRGHVFTNWKTRYFVLRGNVLEYFASDDKGKKYGSVTVAKVAMWSGEAHGFMFYTTKQIPYYVYASSEAERAKWLRALKEFYVEPEEVTCEGNLTKRGHLVPSQRTAYYVLNGTSLRHYTDQAAYRENQSAIAEVEIKALSSWDGEPNGLMFKTVTGSVFYVIADTPGDQQKWLTSFRHVAANIPEPVSCAGYLTKQGHKRKSWKKRYFILRGNMISYYSDYDMANNSKGKPLAEVNVEDVQKWDGEPFGFMFMTTEQVPYYVYADNERERTKWMSALRKLNTVEEEEDVEQKRCTNCNAVLTGSRFCGACGFNLRGTTVKERNGSQPSVNSSAMDMYGNKNDDAELDDEDTAFDELEALSEGARTLLLAVMQTPDGVDLGGDKDGSYPVRTTAARMSTDAMSAQAKRSSGLDLDMTPSIADVKVAEFKDDYKPLEVKPDAKPLASPVAAPGARSPVLPPAKTPERNSAPLFDVVDPTEVDISSVPKEPESKKLVPNFAVVEDDLKNTSFTSFGDSDEESKPEPKPAPIPKKTPPRSSGSSRGGIGPRRTLNQLMMESSSDEEDETELPTKPPSSAYAKGVANEEKEEEEDEKLEIDPADIPNTAERKDSLGSDTLDTTGIAGLEDALEPEKPKVSRAPSMRPSDQKNDLYLHMERELNFTPLFVPSAESIVRCRLYSTMAYSSAKNVIMFVSDSGPMGLWKQDQVDQGTTTNHKWAMLPYFNRALEEGYGIIVCNPFSNTAVVYEAGGFERVVPIPNSSTPKEHTLFVWDEFASKCKGDVSIVAFSRGGALVKSILETYEKSAHEKIHRIAFVESRHEIDASDSPGVRALLGRRSINWEASYEPLGGQIVESQERVGCVCLSIGYMPPQNQDPDNTPLTLEKAEHAVFSFIGANPSHPGMTAIVRHVRAELRKGRKAPTNASKQRRQSNIVVLGVMAKDENVRASLPVR